MVARIGVGDNIEKAIRYNEEKVKDRQAVLLAAEGFPLPAAQLKLGHKIKWFKEITSRNLLTEKNAIHISLSFHRKDNLKGIDLTDFAKEYLEGIGFAGQPFLLYRHSDTANPHLHIVTTNIRASGWRIETHLIGKRVSSPVRERLEEKYNLIRARGRSENEGMLKGIAAKDIAGDPKNFRSKLRNIVREVFDTYHFGTFDEYALILRTLGIKADRGEEGSRMRQFNGLVYAPLNYDGDQDGKSVKASQIFTSPTIARVSERFKGNILQRKAFRGRTALVLRQSLEKSVDIETLQGNLKLDGVDIELHTNAENRTYGVTLVDHITRNVFKGSELDKDFSASKLLQRLAENGNPELVFNKHFISSQLKIPREGNRISTLVAAWKRDGLRVLPHTLPGGQVEYFVGHKYTAFHSFIKAPVPMKRILDRIQRASLQNRSTQPVAGIIQDKSFWDVAGNYFIQSSTGFWEANMALLEPTPEAYDLPPYELLKEARKKKKRKRRD